MARTRPVGPTSSPAATSSTRRARRRFAGSTTALRAPQGPSGIPEVPSTGLPSPPSSPPLAAITSTNQLALTPKAKSSSARSVGTNNGRGNNSNNNSRRGGAALRIREECERFFCETLRAMFLGERNQATQLSVLTGAYYNHHNNIDSNDYGAGFDGARANGRLSSSPAPAGGSSANGRSLPPTPPDDCPMQAYSSHGWATPSRLGRVGSKGVASWLEIWDYAGGSSFRAFVIQDAVGMDKSLFVFFDAHVLGRDLKQALVALIELADGPLACDHMVICLDRTIPADEAKAMIKGLQWAGFSLTTLSTWTSGLDVISDQWLFMGMEV